MRPFSSRPELSFCSKRHWLKSKSVPLRPVTQQHCWCRSTNFLFVQLDNNCVLELEPVLNLAVTIMHVELSFECDHGQERGWRKQQQTTSEHPETFWAASSPSYLALVFAGFSRCASHICHPIGTCFVILGAGAMLRGCGRVTAARDRVSRGCSEFVDALGLMRETMKSMPFRRCLALIPLWEGSGVDVQNAA